VRVADLLDRESFDQQLSFLVPYKNAVLEKLYGEPAIDQASVAKQYGEYGERLAPYVADTTSLVQKAVAAGQTVLLEGAQGSLLDLDTGTYPYVTSSVPSSVAAGAAIGIGIGPSQIEMVVGVYKAYNTRVGNGPFPTELLDETGDMLREGGPRPEYGSTTGRPRRCGWFDGVAARYSSRLNGLTSAVLTRLDVLDQFATIKVCTAYKLRGKTIDTMPAGTNDLLRVEPVYEELPGWKTETAGVRQFDDLPKQAKEYVSFIQDILETQLCLVSVGPQRDQAINIKHIW
jgi:adenylosuccinate synthase